MEDNIYKSPESKLEDSSVIDANTVKGSTFKKTIVMNYVGGILLFVVFVFCVFKMIFSETELLFIGVAVFYALMAFIAFGSAYVIKTAANSSFQLIMLVVNGLCIVFFILGGALIVFANGSMPAFREGFWFFIIFFLLLFVVPQVINILAFRALRK